MNTTPLLDDPAVDPSKGLHTGPVVGVKTTRIYCRPTCRPGRAPKPENCVTFPDAAAARAAGYRACKQCRPDDETPPGRRSRVEVLVRYVVGDTPVGPIFVAATARGVCALCLLEGDDPAEGLKRVDRLFPGAIATADPSLGAVVERVVAHLVDGLPCDDLPLDLRGTPFQLKVWAALRAIPRGETVSYGDLARTLGLPPGASRAVGSACGTNPVSLIVPCHRVLRTGGGLGGYFWGLERKQQLLDLEAGNARPSAQPS